MKKKEVIELIAKRIAKMEGFGRRTSIAARHNNPGNLRAWGTFPVVKGFAVFPDAETGWRALRKQIQVNIDRNLSFYEFFAGKPGVYPGYAPVEDGNNSLNYAVFVASAFDVSASTVIRKLIK